MALDLDRRPLAATAARPVEVRVRGAALSGAVAVAVALAAAEALAGVVPGASSPVVRVGEAVIELAPGALERWAIAALGTADKPALLIGIVVVACVLGAGLGRLAVRRPAVAGAGFAVAGAVGVAAEAAAASPRPAAAVVAAVWGVVAGVVALRFLLGRARAASSAAADAAPPPAGASEWVTPTPAQRVAAASRRRFLLGALSLTALAAGGGALGRLGTLRSRVTAQRGAIALPAASRPLPPPPTGLAVEGLSPLITPTADLYRIDTALSVPRVDVATWSLSLDGMVARPLSLTYDDLLAEDLVEADVTLSCVSNQVGGPLVGTGRWLGVPLARLLERAGADPRATQVVGRSVDGFTAGFPTRVLDDGRAALVAVGLGGEPLPVEHGFPARLVVPGLYGYVSATKWLSSIELTTLEAFDGYWIPRGWSKEGPVRLQSRIDVPRAPVRPGRVAVAGVAWAPTRGIAGVEVRVDGGPWREAALGPVLSDATWVQWSWDWEATPGTHELTVRATTEDGEVQTAERRRVAPDGATGHHTVTARVVA